MVDSESENIASGGYMLEFMVSVPRLRPLFRVFSQSEHFRASHMNATIRDQN